MTNFKPHIIPTIAALAASAALTPHQAQAQSGGTRSYPSTQAPASTAPLPAATGGRAKYEPEGNGVYHGASLPNTWDASGLRTQLQQYQQYAGKRLSVVTWFASTYTNGRMTSWHNEYLGPLTRVRDAGALSLIKFSVQDSNFGATKKMAGLKEITLGVYDAYFQEAADAVKQFGGPVFISINHEMNGTWEPFSEAYDGSQGPAPKVTAADFVSAWKHIVDIFRQRGANNAAFVWSPNVPDVGPVPFTKYYPGDDYVDWIGASFYSGNPIENLDLIYRTYAARKPIFITEWATGEDKNKYYVGFPGEAKWVDSFFKALDTRYPRVKAISWFQWDKRQYGESNYQLQRDPGQQQVYSADIKNPRYLDSAGNNGGTASTGIETARLEVAPREVVLNEVAPVERPKAVPPPQAPPVARIKLQIVPREQVRTER
ncbi:MAG: hypothetical protein JO316_16450 [Abitibacteriaceae bacterium]|nr:hypothetical protein [Abditibacteriaceae bacterium]